MKENCVKKLRRSVLGAVAIVSGGTTALASITFDAVPVTSQSSSQFDTVSTYSPQKLFDGPITVADLGTTNHLGGQYASSGTGNGVYADNDFDPVVSTDYANAVSANSIVRSTDGARGRSG